MVAPVAADNRVTLSPLSTTIISLVGEIVPQDNGEGLSTVSGILNNFIHGRNSSVVVQGASAGPSNVPSFYYVLVLEEY
jgi:hypothetical protein